MVDLFLSHLQTQLEWKSIESIVYSLLPLSVRPGKTGELLSWLSRSPGGAGFQISTRIDSPSTP